MSYRDGYNQLQESNDEIRSNFSPNNAQNYNMNSQRQFNPNKAETDINGNPNGTMTNTQNLVENEDDNNLGYNTNYNNYIQKKRPKTSIRWRNVMKIDLDLIKNTNNLSLLNNYLENFLYSTVTEEDIQAVPEGNVAKLIKILQFVNEFLLNSRQNLNESINSLNEEKQSLINEHQKLEERIKSEKECLDKYNKERKLRMKELADYKNAVNALLQGGIPNFDFAGRTNITSIDINKNIKYNYSKTGFRGPMNGYKCKYCIGKIFSSEFELKKHLNDIHLISQFPDEEINFKSVTQQIPQQINVTMPPLNNNANNNNNEIYEKKLNDMKYEFQQFMNKAEIDSLKNQILNQRNNNPGDDYKLQLERMGNTFNDTLKQILGVIKNNQEQKIIINPIKPEKDLKNDEEINLLRNEIDKVNKILENKRKEHEETKLKLRNEINVLRNKKIQINIEMNQDRVRQPTKKKILSVEQMDTLSYLNPNRRKYYQQEILESDHDDSENETIDLYKKMKRDSELINIILKKKLKPEIKEKQPIEEDEEEEKLRNLNVNQYDDYEEEDLEHFYKKYINRDQNFLNIPVFKRYLKGVLPNQFDNNTKVRKNAEINLNNKLSNTAHIFYKEDTSKIPPTHKINDLVKEDKNDLINLIKDISQDMEMLNKNDDNIKDPYYISVKKLIDFDDIENTVNMLDNNYKEGNLNPKLRTTKKKVTFSSDKLRNRNIGSLKENIKEDEYGDINYYSGGNALSGKEPGDINYFSGGNALSGKEPGDVEYFSGGNALSGKEPGDVEYFSGGNALSGKEPGDAEYFSGGNALSGKEPGDVEYFSGGNALAKEKKNDKDQKDILKSKGASITQTQTQALNNTLKQKQLFDNTQDSGYTSHGQANNPNPNVPDSGYTSTTHGQANNPNPNVPDSGYTSTTHGQMNNPNSNAPDSTYSSAAHGPF